MSSALTFRTNGAWANVIRSTRATASTFRTTRAMAFAIWMRSVTVFFLLDTECQGKYGADGVCHGICLPYKECQCIFPSGRTVLRQMSSEWRVPRHLPSGRGVLVHFSFWTQSVKVNVVRTTYAMASAFWTIRAMVSAFRMRSVRALFLPDAEYQGKYPPDDACHGICIPDDARHCVSLPDEECQGIFPSGHSGCLTDADCQGKCRPDGMCHGIYLPDEECQCIKLLDAARVSLTQGVKADGVRTTYAMAPRVQM